MAVRHPELIPDGTPAPNPVVAASTFVTISCGPSGSKARGYPLDMHGQLSGRAHRLLERQASFDYYAVHQRRSRDRFHPVDNPTGYIGLCVSENLLVADLLLPKMADSRDIPARVLAYDSWGGSSEFRQRVAAFMSRSFLGRPFDPSHLYALAGASAVLEAFFYAIADPGDAVLVPTPSYAGFWADIEGRDEVDIVPVHGSSADRFALTTANLDAAAETAEGPVRALLFTSPDNPLGRVYGPAQIEEVVEWCETRDVHLLVDEIYALSVFGEVPFTSVASLRDPLGDKLHIVWAFSKDFGMSGLRCGVVYTENEEIGRSLSAQAMWSSVSGDTQHLLASMVSDQAWVDGYLTTMQDRLREAYRRTTGALDEWAIPYLDSGAGFFLLCDLRPFLRDQTWEAEHALWQQFLEEANVNLTPGAACRIGEPGFMRLCFAAEQTDTVVAGIEKIGKLLAS